MPLLAPLATAALIGTERRPPAWPTPGGAVGELLEKLGPLPVERRVLTSAGILAVSAAAGHRPPRAAAPLAPAAPDTARVRNDPRFVAVCAQILAEGPERLQAELFQQLARHGSVLAPRLLPAALRAGRQSTRLRPALLPVLGQRGGWLAQQNAEWNFAIGAGAADLDERQWHEGALAARTRFLALLRQHDPARSRELLAATLPAENARDRVALLSVLAIGLAPADEPLLATTLSDRSKEVRAAAARLLARLPGSALAQRMAARLEPLLQSERKLLRTVLTLDAPAVFGTDWAADTLEAARPTNETLGERAWWLFQIIRLTPLAWWEQRTGRSPAELVKWAAGSDWQLALLRGWLEAQTAQPQPAWAEALLAMPTVKGLEMDPFTLLESLPPAARERHWLALLEGPLQSAGHGAVLQRIAQTLPLDAGPLSGNFGARVLQRLRAAVNTGAARDDYALRPVLADFACWLPPALLPEAATGWQLGGAETPSFTEAIARFLSVLELRQTLHRSLASVP